MKLATTLIAAGFAGGLLYANQAQAIDRYGVACLTNRTNATIKYEIQIGNGGWTSFSLSPGAHRWFAHKYDAPNRDNSPTLHIRFDSDLRRGSVFEVPQALQRRASPEDACADGKQYVFHCKRCSDLTFQF